MSYRLALSIVTGVGLLACIIFVVGYWLVTRGSWHREEAGRFLIALTSTIGILFVFVLVGQLTARDDVPWTFMRIFALIIYVEFVAIMWWPLRLLVLAQREKRGS